MLQFRTFSDRIEFFQKFNIDPTRYVKVWEKKNYGNIARYIAYSCDPNWFSQKMININSQPINEIFQDNDEIRLISQR